MSEPVQARVMGLQEAVPRIMNGVLTAACVRLGDRLGLYRAMEGQGPLSARDLAARTGLNERFLLEWLRQQAAADILLYQAPDRFELDAPAASMFADDTSAAFMAGLMVTAPELFQMMEHAESAFRTGLGRPFAEANAARVQQVSRGPLQTWARNALVQDVLPRLPGVTEALQAGGAACDIGCGGGAAPIAIAAAFPRARVVGYDTWDTILGYAETAKDAAQLTNVSFLNPDRDQIPETPEFDLVITADVLHDLPRPDLMASSIRQMLKPSGTWLIVDVESSESFEDQLRRPNAASTYGTSIALCLQAGTSTPDGRALGMVGLPESAMRRLVLGAGFTGFDRVPGLTHPFNAFYMARP